MSGPRPWMIDENSIVSAGGFLVGVINVGDGITRKDAELVVAAVNAYEPLLELVRMLRDRLDEEEMGEQTGNHVAIWQAIHEGARAAIEAIENTNPHKDALT